MRPGSVELGSLELLGHEGDGVLGRELLPIVGAIKTWAM